MNSLLQDLRFGIRILCKSPAFAVLSILTLALGIGANTAIFSVLNTLLLHPLPYPEQERLVGMYRTSPQSKRWSHSAANFLEYREQNRIFEALAAFQWKRFGAGEPGQPPESLNGISATADFFEVLGARPLLGRVFTVDEEQPGRDRVLVLSHRLWVQRYGADSNVISKIVRVEGRETEIIGVMPASFDYPLLWGHVEAWRPLALTPQQRQDRGDHSLRAIGRLKSGVTFAQARAELAALAVRFAEAYPEANANSGLEITPLSESIGDAASRKFAWFMLGLTVFILLIACTNLANLQMARAVTRTREVAVRLALGAGRARLARQMFVESVLVAICGGLLGLFLAVEVSGFIGERVTFPSGYRGLRIPVDRTVLAFALGSSLLTAVLFGIAPAWAAARANLNDLLKGGARGATANRSHARVQYGLIVAQVALALTLLTGAGLFTGGLQRFMESDPGWKVDGLLSGWIFLDNERYPTDQAKRDFIWRLEERLSRLGGIESFGLSSSLPVWSLGRMARFDVEGKPSPSPGKEPMASVDAANAGFFKTMGLDLKRGRYFTNADSTNTTPVVLINETMARTFWPNQDPIGKRIGNGDHERPAWREIVGVVSDVRFPANLNPPETQWQIYRPMAQETPEHVSIELRYSGNPADAASSLRRAVAELDADLPVNDLQITRAFVDRLLANFQLSSSFLTAFALLGVVLATVGIYGVISCFVAQRTGEMGIRMALGAQAFDVLFLVLRKGMLLSAVGLLIGLAGAFAIHRILTASVPELPSDLTGTLGVTVAAIGVVTVMACWLPARRAARVDPMVALRVE